MGRVLMTIVADTSARHDALCGAHDRARRTSARYGDGGVHGRHAERPRAAGRRRGQARPRARATSPTGINLFKRRRVGDDGALQLRRRRRGPARHVELRAELDVIVLLANVPHPLDDAARRTRGSTVRVHGVARPRTGPSTTRCGRRRPSASGRFENTDDCLAGGARDDAHRASLDEVVAGPGRRGRHVVPPGETLRIVDLGGNQAVDCLLYNAARPRPSATRRADTIAAQRQHLPRHRHACCAPTRATR